MPAVVTGASVYLDRKFELSTFWDSVHRSGATALPFVGALFALLAKQPPDAGDHPDAGNPLRVAYGIPIPSALHEEFEKRFDVQLLHAYGSTEATIPAWNTGPDRVIGAAGQIVDEFEVSVRDESDQPLPSGRASQICVRPREPFSMFQGYHRDSERTTTAFRNLWFHTGDLGCFDDRGHLWFERRMDDVIRRMGEFINAVDVERAIGEHPSVLMTAIFGVPSELAEDEVMACVVLKSGRHVSPSDLREWLTTCVSRFAVPRFIEFVTALPMTATGRIEKYQLRSRGVTSATDDVRATRKGKS